MQALFRTVAGTFALLLLLGLVACGQAATPASPSSKPVESAASPSKPAASAATSPGASAKPAASASAGASADQKAEWDKIVAAAKKEGKVVVDGPRGDLYRQAAMAFKTAYPDIQLEFTGLQGGDFQARVMPERDAGQFLWDVYVGGAGTASAFKEMGVLDPIKPALLLPEVLDDSKWSGGFDDGWLDKDNQYIYQFLGYLQNGTYVNRDMVPESQLSSYDQLLDPKWKGKIAVQDPRQGGAGQQYFEYMYIVKGEDFVRKLLSQDLVLNKDPRLMLESVIRGRYPIAIGATLADLQAFEQQGALGNLKPLDTNNLIGTKLTGGSGNVTLINKAPHPNAAKVYVNWLLTQAGQKAFVDAIAQGSRRLDVPTPPGGDTLKPGVKYVNNGKEEYAAQNKKAIEIVKEALK